MVSAKVGTLEDVPTNVSAITVSSDSEHIRVIWLFDSDYHARWIGCGGFVEQAKPKTAIGGHPADQNSDHGEPCTLECV